jgi:hypothetical protein
VATETDSYTCDNPNSVYKKAEVENQSVSCFTTAFYRLVYKAKKLFSTGTGHFMDFSVEKG